MINLFGNKKEPAPTAGEQILDKNNIPRHVAIIMDATAAGPSARECRAAMAIVPVPIR